MAKLRCGVAGLGRGKLFVSIFESLPDCEVVAVCDTNPRALEPFGRYARYTDFDVFIASGMDVVAVITPGPAHAEQSVKALDRGIHVLCETPCIYSVQEARKVIRAAERSRKKYMLAENYIWMGWFLTLQQWQREGFFGSIIYAEGDYTHDCRDIMLMVDGAYIPYRDRALHPQAIKSWRAEHFPPLSYSSHTLGPLLTLMQDRVTECIGLGTGGRTAPDLGTIDLEVGLMRTHGGAAIRLTNGFTVAHPMAFQYKIVGTRGSAIVQAVDGCTVWSYSDAENADPKKWKSTQMPFGKRTDGRESTAVMTEEFVKSIIQDTPAPIDAYASIGMVLPGVLAHESAMEEGRKTKVPDLRQP